MANLPRHLKNQDNSCNRRSYNGCKIPGHSQKHKIADIRSLQSHIFHGKGAVHASEQSPQYQKRKENTARRPGTKADKGKQKFYCKQHCKGLQYHIPPCRHINKSMTAAQYLRQQKPQNACQQKRNQKSCGFIQPFCLKIQPLHPYGHLIIKSPHNAQQDSQNHNMPVIPGCHFLSDIKLKHRSKSQKFAGYVVCSNGSCHNRYQYRYRKIFMYFFQRKQNPCKRSVKGCRKSGAGAAGQQVPLLRLFSF